MSVEVWKISKNLCRCCHSEGAFDNLAEPQQNMDQVEIYSNMLKECFNVEVIPMPGELCAPTYTICKSCILRLRDASSFRKQVLHCEERFMELYLNDAIKGYDSEKIYMKDEDVDPVMSNVLNSEKRSYIKEEDGESETDYNEDYISLDDDNDDEYDIKHDEDNPDSEEELNLTLRKRKTKMKPKIEKTKCNQKTKHENKKMNSSDAKGKRGAEVASHYTVRQDANCTLYTCNICESAFRKRDLFKQHYRHVHLKQRPKLIGCYYCEVKVSAHMRAYHLERVHGIPAPTCGACGKKFPYPFQVLKHQKVYHMGERKFACNVCDRSFASRGNLVQHQVKHSSLRPFKCDLCDETFKLKKHLTRHRLTHLNQKR